MNRPTACRGRVLVIDDTPVNLGLLSTLLSANGYQVHAATSAHSALRFLRTALPELILLDVVMPEMSGFDVCERLKADSRTRDVPVIFISAADHALDKVRAFSSGGVDYIVKPFQPEEVLARVETHLALRALRHNLEEKVQEKASKLLETHARIEFMAHHDALTGLANRLLFENRVDQAIARARHAGGQVAVLFIDLDHFKDINDTLGHHAGDKLLRDVAQRLQAAIREGDSVARLGGDEFVIALSGIARHQDAMQVAGKVLDCLRAPFLVDMTELHVSASVGISLFPSNGQNAGALLGAADTAMYHAKDRGRDNVQFFMPHLNDAAQRRLAIANRLHFALQREEFSLYYQPQVDLESGRVFSVEALLRWSAADLLGVSACEFIRVAEETGLIVSIGEWVLRQACAQLARWRASGYDDLQLAVNLSPRQLRHPGFHELVVEVLGQCALPAKALELEITEGMLMQNSAENVILLERLAALGVRVAVDDFGTGYSNLAYLRRFPIDSLKIDQAFVKGIGENANDTAIVTTIMAMAHALRLKVVAEGVETPEQAAFLCKQGCLAAQGYLYSQAIPATAMEEMLRRQASADFRTAAPAARADARTPPAADPPPFESAPVPDQ